MNTVLLIIAAVLPAVLLCKYVYKMDRVEKEPRGLLVILFLAGVVSCFPAAAIEGILGEITDGAFTGLLSLGVPFSALDTAYDVITYFIGVALVEEALKWLCLIFITKNNKNFNCLFDGLIYAVFVSLGFAAFENILYVLRYGWVNAFMRGVLSVPGHMFFAVMMGYYYSRWILLERTSEAEKELEALGLIEKREYPSFDCRRDRLMSLIVPILFHGTYNFCCSKGSLIWTMVFYAFVIFMYVHCFGKIKEMSLKDTPSGKKAARLLLDKYPDLYEKAVKR